MAYTLTRGPEPYRSLPWCPPLTPPAYLHLNRAYRHWSQPGICRPCGCKPAAGLRLCEAGGARRHPQVFGILLCAEHAVHARLDVYLRAAAPDASVWDA